MAKNQLLTDGLPTLAEVLTLGSCVLGSPKRALTDLYRYGWQVFIDLSELWRFLLYILYNHVHFKFFYAFAHVWNFASWGRC